MASSAHRRAAARAVVKRGLCSGRLACRFLRLARATFLYRGRPLSSRQQRLAKRLRVLSEAHPRYGYRRIAALLRQKGWAIGKRQVQRLRRADGLRVAPTRRRLVRQGISTGLPTKAAHRGHVWTWDLVSDATVRGGALKTLTILDEFTRECHVLRPERALRASDVLAWLERAINTLWKPSDCPPALSTISETTLRACASVSDPWRAISAARDHSRQMVIAFLRSVCLVDFFHPPLVRSGEAGKPVGRAELLPERCHV